MSTTIVQRIDDNVVRMGTWIVNWYLVAGDDGVTVVDAAFPTYSRQLGDGLRELERSQSEIKAIVLTHAHADHVGFAEKLRRKLDIPVYVHRAEEELATSLQPFGPSEGSLLPYLRHPMSFKLIGEMVKSGGGVPQKIGEVTIFDDGDELPVPGRLRAIHTPGHTAGHTSFVTGEVLLAGDALCNLNPLTGEHGPQLMPQAFNLSTDQALASLDNLVGTHTKTLLMGHGDPLREPNGAVEQAKQRGPT